MIDLRGIAVGTSRHIIFIAHPSLAPYVITYDEKTNELKLHKMERSIAKTEFDIGKGYDNRRNARKN